MTEATGVKKPAQGGLDEKPFISDEMRDAGWSAVDDLMETYPPNMLAEAVYIAMAGARPLALRLAETECLSVPSGPADASSTL